MELTLKLEAKLIICPSTQTILRMVQIARPNANLKLDNIATTYHHTRHNVTEVKNLESNIPFSQEHLKLLKIHTASNP